MLIPDMFWIQQSMLYCRVSQTVQWVVTRALPSTLTRVLFQILEARRVGRPGCAGQRPTLLSSVVSEWLAEALESHIQFSESHFRLLLKTGSAFPRLLQIFLRPAEDSRLVWQPVMIWKSLPTLPVYLSQITTHCSRLGTVALLDCGNQNQVRCFYFNALSINQVIPLLK